LGCRIEQTDQERLVCPCHGSSFSADGGVQRGPANRPLKPLGHSIDPITGTITVNLKS
jgi:Rieske Fe-S protein